MGVIFNKDKDGFQTIMKDYQEMALRFVLDSGEGLTSREVWVGVNKGFGGSRTISRASIINFLNSMCEEGVIEYEEETAKGGRRRRYFPGIGEEGLKRQVAKEIISKLSEM